jgi:protein-tyrosine phosphatase
MISFFKKKTGMGFPFYKLEADMHSHLIPGIDDGSPDISTSIELIQGLEDLGYKRFVATPHAMEDLYPNNVHTIQAAFMALNDVLAIEQPDTQIRFAAEYLMDGNVDLMLDRKETFLTVKDNWVLVEFSFVSPPIQLKEVIFNLQMQGYQPILAHPERYGYFHQQPSRYAEIKAMGCFFQANLLSFSGYYGSSVRQAVEYLVEHKLIDLLGTDLHHHRHLEQLRNLPLTPALGSLVDEQGVLNHLI